MQSDSKSNRRDAMSEGKNYTLWKSTALPQVNMSVFEKFILFLIFYPSVLFCSDEISGNGFCVKDDSSCPEEAQKTVNFVRNNDWEFHNQIRSEISSARNSYTECPYSNCSCFLSVLHDDLKPFERGITKKMIEDVRPRGTTYVVHEKKLYREKDCMFPARCSGIEHFLKQLLPKLKNTELVINTRDWPQVSKHFRLFGPVLSFSKTSDYLDVMYPAWSFWEGGPAIKTYPTGLGRWDLHRSSLHEESLKWPWEKKNSMGFFRGSRTSEKRDVLVLLSRKKPDLIDAQYTKNQAWKSSDDTLGKEPADVVTLEHHCRYKYLFNFKGVAASFRFKHLFLCGSLVIHFGDDWLEFFYPALKPWVHYIPLKEDASEQEVVRLMLFLHENDKLAREIADAGKKFIYEHLSLKEVKCYWKSLLKHYTKLLKYTVTLEKSLIEIK